MDYQYQRDYYLIMREEDVKEHKYYKKSMTKSIIIEPNDTIGTSHTKTRQSNKKTSKEFHYQPHSSSFNEGNSKTVHLNTNQRKKPDRLSGKNNFDSSRNSGIITPFKLDSNNNILPILKNGKKMTHMPPEIEFNLELYKYWAKRFSLFSKFDEGIKLDEESWYSVTPELVAKQIAERCTCKVIVDAFCGAGGNTIQFALTCSKVIAIDIDPKKIELAKNNARVYGVADKIHFIVGDFLQLAGCLEGDMVFLSPPWGGPAYVYQEVYDLEKMLLPVPFSKLLAAARKISSSIAAYLPRNSNVAKETDSNNQVEIEMKYNRNRPLANVVYYNIPLK